MPVVTTHLGQIFYAQRGRAGPAALCVHGAGGTHAHWGHQLRDLADTARVYALDLPGHGRSAPPAHDRIAGYADAALALLDALGLERATLIGHSMGGAVCLQAALHAPERVAGLGLVGSGARLRVLPELLAALEHDPPAALRRLAELSYAPDAPQALREQGLRAALGSDPAVCRADFLACDRFDCSARLGQIQAPAAVVVGAHDRLTPPKYARAMQAALPGARLFEIPAAGHMAMLEQPAAVSAALRTLLITQQLRSIA